MLAAGVRVRVAGQPARAPRARLPCRIVLLLLLLLLLLRVQRVGRERQPPRVVVGWRAAARALALAVVLQQPLQPLQVEDDAQDLSVEGGRCVGVWAGGWVGGSRAMRQGSGQSERRKANAHPVVQVEERVVAQQAVAARRRDHARPERRAAALVAPGREGRRAVQHLADVPADAVQREVVGGLGLGDAGKMRHIHTLQLHTHPPTTHARPPAAHAYTPNPPTQPHLEAEHKALLRAVDVAPQHDLVQRRAGGGAPQLLGDDAVWEAEGGQLGVGQGGGAAVLGVPVPLRVESWRAGRSHNRLSCVHWGQPLRQGGRGGVPAPSPSLSPLPHPTLESHL
jgi:hypothetical protein